MKNLDQNRSFGLLLGAVCAIFAVLAYRTGRSSDGLGGARRRLRRGFADAIAQTLGTC